MPLFIEKRIYSISYINVVLFRETGQHFGESPGKRGDSTKPREKEVPAMASYGARF